MRQVIVTVEIAIEMRFDHFAVFIEPLALLEVVDRCKTVTIAGFVYVGYHDTPPCERLAQLRRGPP